MKFVHIADMHLDSPFANLSQNGFGDQRRLEQRKVFQEVISYIKENNIPYFFISGDLYEQEYVKLSTIEYINHLFKEIPNTKIFISPGNHDPFLKNSYYTTYTWSDNVHIFKGDFERIELDDVDIYGFGFIDFYCQDAGIKYLEIKNKEKLNILVMHGTLDGGGEYNPITTVELRQKGFDYVALGHIHKTSYQKDFAENIVYSGSVISFGFDEIGQEHGMIVGIIGKDTLELKHVPLDPKIFKEINLDISEINNQEELIEKINELKIENNHFIKLILIGENNFLIHINLILKLIREKNILKIENNTKIKYDLEKIKEEKSLKGIFIRRLLELKKNKNYSKKEIESAILIGLDNLSKI